MNNALQSHSFTKDELAAAIDKFPTLNVYGFCYVPRSERGSGNPYHPEDHKKAREKFFEESYRAQIETVIQYLLHYSIGKRFTSYTLKHVAERWGKKNGYEHYIANGSAVIGAVLSGYSVQRERKSPNCKFR